MCSDRVCKYENFNNQNNTGWHQNLGMHYLYTPGCTFENYVNDNKGKGFLLPGVTCRELVGKKIKNSEQPRFNYTRDDMKHLRSGGCKIDKNAVAAMMQVVDDGLFARKSWFMIDDTIYCIGTALKGEHLFTTIYNGDKEIKLLDEHTAFIEDFGTVTCKTNELKIKGNILYIDNYHCYEYSITPLKQIEYNYPYENVTRYYDDLVHMMHSRNNDENKYLFNFWKAGNAAIGDVVLESNRDLVSVGLQKLNNGNIYLMISDILRYQDYTPYEACKVLNLRGWAQFKAVTLPYLRKPMISVFFATFTMIVTDYGVPLMIGGKYMTLPVLMYQEVIGMLDFAKGATIGTIFLIPAVIAFVLDLVNKDKAGSSFTKKSFPSVVSKPVLGFSYGFCLITIIFVLLPILSFIILSVVKKYPINMSFTFSHILKTLNTGGLNYLGNSLIIALLNSCVDL